MSKTMKRILLVTLFVICVFALTVVGASAASADGYADDAAAIADGKVARIGGTADSNDGATYYATWADTVTALSSAPGTYNVYVVADDTAASGTINLNKADWHISVTGIGDPAPKLTFASGNPFAMNASNISLTLENLEITVATHVVISDGNNATNSSFTVKSGTTIKTGATMTERLFYLYDPCDVTVEAGAKIDTSATTFTKSLWIFDLATTWKSTLIMNGEVLVGGTSNGSQIRVFNSTGGFPGGKIITGETAKVTLSASGIPLGTSGIFIAYGDIEINGGTYHITSASKGYVVLTSGTNSSTVKVTGNAVLRHDGEGTILNRSGGSDGVITVNSTSAQLIAKGSATVFRSPYYIKVIGAYLSCEAATPYTAEGDRMRLYNVSFPSAEMAKKFGETVRRVGDGTRRITVDGQLVETEVGYFVNSTHTSVVTDVTAEFNTAVSGKNVQVVDASGVAVYVASLADASRNVYEGAVIYASGATADSPFVNLEVNGFNVTLYYTGDTAPDATAFGEAVARVDDSGKLYTIPYAEKLVADGGTIYITAGYTHTAGVITFSSNKSFTIMGELVGEVYPTITVNGTGTLFDLENAVNVTVDNVNFVYNNATASGQMVEMSQGAKLTLGNVTITSSGATVFYIAGTTLPSAPEYNAQGYSDASTVLIIGPNAKVHALTSTNQSLLNVAAGYTDVVLQGELGYLESEGASKNVYVIWAKSSDWVGRVTITGKLFSYTSKSGGDWNHLLRIEGTGVTVDVRDGATLEMTLNSTAMGSYIGVNALIWNNGTTIVGAATLNSVANIFYNNADGATIKVTGTPTVTVGTGAAVFAAKANTIYFEKGDADAILFGFNLRVGESKECKTYYKSIYDAIVKGVAPSGTGTASTTQTVVYVLHSYTDSISTKLANSTTGIREKNVKICGVDGNERPTVTIPWTGMMIDSHYFILEFDNVKIVKAAGNLVYMGSNATVTIGENAVIEATSINDATYGLFALNGANTTLYIKGTVTGDLSVANASAIFLKNASAKLYVEDGALIDISGGSGNSNPSIIYCTGGKVVINGGKITSTAGLGSATRPVFMYGASTEFEMHGGEIDVASGNNVIYSSGKVTMDGGKVVAGAVGNNPIRITGTATISGTVEISNTGYNGGTFYITTGGNLTISSGKFSAQTGGLFLLDGNGILTVTGDGTFEQAGGGNLLATSSTSLISISGGNFSHSGAGNIVNLTSTASATVSGGSFSHSGAGDIIQVAGSGTLTVSGESFTHSGEGDIIQVAGSGTLTVLDGDFSHSGTGNIVLGTGAGSKMTISGGTLIHSGSAGAPAYVNSANASGDDKTTQLTITGTAALVHKGSGESYVVWRDGGGIVINGEGVKLIALGNNYIFDQGYCNSTTVTNNTGNICVTGAYLYTERSDGNICNGDPSYLKLSNVAAASDSAAAALRGTTSTYYLKARILTGDATSFELDGNTYTVYRGYYANYSEAIASVPTDGTQATLVFLGNSIARVSGAAVKAGQNIVFDGLGSTYTINGSNATTFISVNEGGSLTVKNMQIVGCPTCFAVVAGSFSLTEGSTLTMEANANTSETGPVFQVTGAGELTIPAGTGLYTVYPNGERLDGEPSYTNKVRVIELTDSFTGTVTIGGTISHKWDSHGDWGPIFRVAGSGKIVLLSTAVLEMDTTETAAGGNALFLESGATNPTTALKVEAGAQVRSTTYPLFAGKVFFDSDESALNLNPNYTARIGDDLLCSAYYETYQEAIAAVPASGTATIYLIVDVIGAHEDLAYKFIIDSQTITISGVLKGDGTYTSLTTTGSSKANLFTFANNNVETYLTFANINITVSGPFLFGDCPGSTLTLGAGTVLKTAQTLGGDYLIKCYDWAVITLNAGATIDTTGSTVAGDYQLINFYSTGSGTTNANAAVNINGEIIFKLTGPEATSQLRVFSMTDGFAGTITIGETADITYAPVNAKTSTSGVFVAYANIEINGGTFTMGVYDAEGPDTTTIGYLIYFSSQTKTVNVNAGTFTNYTNSNMYHGAVATLNIKGGSFTASGSGNILNVTGGTVTISGDTLTQTGTGRVIYNESAGTVNISGGTLAHSGSQVIMDSYGTLNISVGKFEYTGTYQMLKLRGKTTITGGTFTNTATAGSNTMIESSGTTTISGTASFECASTGVVFNVWGGSFTVNGGSFKTATASAIISNSYPVTIAGGRFEHSGAGNILNAGSGEITNVSATESLVVFKHTGSGMIFNNPSNQWIHVDGGASSNVQIIAENTSQVFFDGYCAAVANAYIYVADTAKYVSASGDDLFHISYKNVMFDSDAVAAKMYAFYRTGETATIEVDGQTRTVYIGYYGDMFDRDDALSAALESGKLYLVRDGGKLNRGSTVAQGKTLVIDGQGHTLTVVDANDVYFLTVEGNLTVQNVTITANGLFAKLAGGSTMVLGDNATLSGTWKDTGSAWRGYIELEGEGITLTTNATSKIVSDTSNPAKEVYAIQTRNITDCVITLRGEIECKHVMSSNTRIVSAAGTAAGSELHVYGTIKNNASTSGSNSTIGIQGPEGTHVYVYSGAVLTQGAGTFEKAAPILISAHTLTITGGTFTATGTGHNITVSGGACNISGGTFRNDGTGNIINATKINVNVTDDNGTALFKHTGTGIIFNHTANTPAEVHIDGANVHVVAMNGAAAFYEGWKVWVTDAYLHADEASRYVAADDWDHISHINTKFESASVAAKFYAYFLVGEPTTITVDGEEKQVYAGYDVLATVWGTVTTDKTNTITVVKDYTVVAGDVKTFDGAYTIVLQGVENGEGGYTKLTETISDLFLNIKKGTNLTTKNIEIVSDGSLAQVDAGGIKTYLILGENTKLTTAATVRDGDLFLLWNVGYITVTESAVIDTTGSTVSGRLQIFNTKGNAYDGEIRIEGTITHALTCTGDSKIVRFSSKTGTLTVTGTANITYSCNTSAVTPENAIFHNYPGSDVSIYDVCYTYNIEGGTITHTSASGSVFYGAGYGGLQINLKGGTVNVTGGGSLAHMTLGAEFTMSGGTVNLTDSYLFSGDMAGTFYVSGGTVNLKGSAVMMKSAEYVFITGGTFTAEANAVGATSAGNTVGVTIRGASFADDATAGKLLANFRANGVYYTSLKDAMAALSGTENTIYVVGNGLRKVDRTAGGFQIAAGSTLTLEGVSGLGVMNVNGMNDTYMFVVNGTLVLKDLTLTNCPTRLADVSGTLTMTGVTANLYTKRDDEAAVHETSPFIYLQGNGVASLDAETAVNFTYESGDTTHDAVDYQASIYVFRTAENWQGTLTILGDVTMGWNVRGYSAIFYLQSTKGSIVIGEGAQIVHTATEGAPDNTLLISTVTEGNENGNNPGATSVTVGEGARVEALHFEIRAGHINAVNGLAKSVFGYVAEAIEIVITWEDTIHFVYNYGTWNTEDHVYEGAGWSATNNSDRITVENVGDVDVVLTFVYAQASGYEDINGSFAVDGTPITQSGLALATGEEKTVIFSLSGAFPGVEETTTIGTITITVNTEGE